MRRERVRAARAEGRYLGSADTDRAIDDLSTNTPRRERDVPRGHVATSLVTDIMYARISLNLSTCAIHVRRI